MAILTKEEREIFTEVKNAYINEGFLDWIVESDFIEISHNYICKCLNEFAISDKTFTKLEEKLFDYVSNLQKGEQ
tara:strand:+ start:261 stop:485 length:225 start_codon:yes stop_codon:yes gene_type:complete